LVQELRGRDLLSISDLSADEVLVVMEMAARLKNGESVPVLRGQTLALVFEKPSLGTGVSFEVAMRQLGGQCLYLSPPEVGLGERETTADVARVPRRYIDVLAARTFKPNT